MVLSHTHTISRGNTDLHYLARCGKKELAPEAKTILISLANDGTKENDNDNGDTVLMKHGNKLLWDAEKILRSNSSLAYKTNDDGDTPLHVAARLGYFEMAKLLLTYSKTIVVEEGGRNLLRIVNNLEENTALHEAARNGHEKVVKLLLEEDSSLASLKNKAGESPLFLAIDGNFHNVAICILESCTNCSYEGRNGMTVMHAVAIRTQEYNPWFSWLRKHLDLIAVHSTWLVLDAYDLVDKLLDKFGLKILEKRDNFGWLPLHYAAHLGNVKVIKKLFERNETSSIAYIKNDENMSALHTAAMNDQNDVIKILMDKCVKIADLLDKRDRTALHVAVERGKSRVVKTLLNKMSYDMVNRKDKDGNTCLHLAAFYGRVKILIVLATHKKVDKKAINNAGMNAVDACELSTKLDSLATVITTRILKEKGTLPSLERAVVRATKITRHNKTLGRFETSQDQKQQNLLIFSKDVDTETTHQNKGKEVHDISGENQQRVISDKAVVDTKLTDGDNTKTPAVAQEEGPVSKGSIYSQEEINTMINVNLVVATIIASVTFSAIIAMPGGYNDNGIAILSEKTSFNWFLVFDALAFGSSSTLIFIHFSVALYSRFVLDRNKTYPLSWVVWLTITSTVSMIVAFVLGIYAVLEETGLSFYGFGLVGIVTSAIVPGTLFVIRRIYCFVDDITLKGLIYSILYLISHGF